jgi:hypothetical protein
MNYMYAYNYSNGCMIDKKLNLVLYMYPVL